MCVYVCVYTYICVYVYIYLKDIFIGIISIFFSLLWNMHSEIWLCLQEEGDAI